MTATPSLWGSTVRVETVDPDAAGLARRMVAGCLTAVRTAADPLRARSGPQRLAAAGGRPVAVEGLFADLVLAALDAARDTDGLVDPTIGNAVLRRRERRDVDVRPAWNHPHLLVLPACSGGTATAARPVAVGWRRVEHVDHRVAVPAGTLLDVTAIAKPFLAIAASAYAAQRTGTGVLVDVGGDVAHHGPLPVGGWRVRVGDGDALRLGVGRALSGVRPDGIIDPATGRPVAPIWRHVAVLDRSAIGAKAAALAAHVLGEDAPSWLADRGLAARLERADGEVLRLPGWPVGLVAPRPPAVDEALAPAS